VQFGNACEVGEAEPPVKLPTTLSAVIDPPLPNVCETVL
jgi:hypothetical protein